MLTQELETVACSNCGSLRSEPIYRLNDTLYDLPGDFTSNRCLTCGLIYLSPRPSRDSIGDYYPPNYENFRPPIENEKFALMRWMRQRKLTKRNRLIERYSHRNSGDLLDVGCATGIFLNEMANSGWQVSGVETNPYAAELARNYFHLDVFTGFLQDANFDSKSFDVITFWDVLEHTFSPLEEILKAAELMRPGGMLVLSVPNWDSVERRLFGKYWQGFDPPRHLYVFTEETLSLILDKAGFNIVAQVCFMTGYFSFILSLERLLKSLNPSFSSFVSSFLRIPGLRLLFEPWFSFNNWRRKGSVITYFAQKNST